MSSSQTAVITHTHGGSGGTKGGGSKSPKTSTSNTNITSCEHGAGAGSVGGQQQQPKLNIKKRISVQKVNPQCVPQHIGAFPAPVQNIVEFNMAPHSQPVGVSKTQSSERLSRKKPNQLPSAFSKTSPASVASKSGCVTFQFETDGRSTFPNQKDFHDYSKQRDLFYAIKTIWTTQRSEASSHQSVPSNYSSYDPAYSKMKQLFQLNSTPTNMNRLAMLFLSQCILDSVFCGGQGSKTEGGSAFSSMNPETQRAENNVRKFLQSNPSRLEQLRNRVAPNTAVFEIDFIQINDPVAFLKYFVGSPASVPTFSQYLIDHAVQSLLEVSKVHFQWQ